MRSDNQLLWWSHCYGTGKEEDKNVLDIFSFVHISMHVFFFKHCKYFYLFACLSPWLRDTKIDKNGIWDLGSFKWIQQIWWLKQNQRSGLGSLAWAYRQWYEDPPSWMITSKIWQNLTQTSGIRTQREFKSQRIRLSWAGGLKNLGSYEPFDHSWISIVALWPLWSRFRGSQAGCNFVVQCVM